MRKNICSSFEMLEIGLQRCMNHNKIIQFREAATAEQIEMNERYSITHCVICTRRTISRCDNNVRIVWGDKAKKNETARVEWSRVEDGEWNSMKKYCPSECL